MLGGEIGMTECILVDNPFSFLIIGIISGMIIYSVLYNFFKEEESE